MNHQPSNAHLHWYVVQSKPREEERAQHFLQEKGFLTYLPRMEMVKMLGLRAIRSQKPLFPGYLFCSFDPEESLAYVRWGTRGVLKILPESATPVAVGDEVLAGIRSLEQKDGVIRKKPLRKNDRVRIARGPMKDLLGIFDEWSSDNGRVPKSTACATIEGLKTRYPLLRRVGFRALWGSSSYYDDHTTAKTERADWLDYVRMCDERHAKATQTNNVVHLVSVP